MKRLFLLLAITICYLSAFSQEIGIIQKRYENFKKLNTGMSPDEVVTLLSFETDINKSFFGGIFIGIGLLSENSNNPSSYKGTLNLHEYKFIFDNGKLKEKSIDSTKIGSMTISGQYINELIGRTQTTWTLIDGKFNSNSVAVEYTAEEKRIINEQNEQRRIKSDKRLKELTDSLTNDGYKIVTSNGFDSFIIWKTRLQEILSTLGLNNIREDSRKNGLTKITYPELGISFYFVYDKKTENGFLREIRLRSPFKGYCIENGLEGNFWGVVLNKTTLKDFNSHYKNMRFSKWVDEDNCRFIKKSAYDDDTKYVYVSESLLDNKYSLNDLINEFRIYKENGIHISGF